MRKLRKAEDRGQFNFGWLDTRHSFSFGEYFDPDHHHYHSLRVLNDDRVAPGQGFGTHGHRDMEILTWVLDGALEHRDSLGTHGIIRPGEAQVMSAGTGIKHSEFNHSPSEPVHFLQIWFPPEANGLSPRYDQIHFDDGDLRNRWCVIASGGGEARSAKIFQDVKVSVARLDPDTALAAELPEGRSGYLHVATGGIELEDGTRLEAGDALRVEAEAAIGLRAELPSEVLWFELA